MVVKTQPVVAREPTSPSTLASVQQYTDPSDLRTKTYMDKAFGYLVQYSDTLTPQEVQHTADMSVVGFIDYKHLVQGQSYGVTISAVRGVSTCFYVPDVGYSAVSGGLVSHVGTTTMQGVPFASYDISFSNPRLGSGLYSVIHHYRAFHQQNCYEIDYTASGQKNVDAIQNSPVLEAVVQSFQFTQ